MLLVLVLLIPVARAQARFNGFDVSNSRVTASEIRSGGPGRNGIPAIDQPKFVAPDKASFLGNEDQVLSVTLNGETRAYPLRILVWHEIVNDGIGEARIAVTYCPLCGTGMVFDRNVAGRTVDFGVSGLLYQSDMLMYDRQTESLWSQLDMKAIAGKMAGTALTWLPSRRMSWQAWKREYPEGKVLSTETGHRRDYSRTPYSGYEDNERTMFPVPSTRKELRHKEWIVGVVVNQVAAAYALKALKRQGVVEETVGGASLRIAYDPDADSVRAVTVESNEDIPIVQAYWFAWQAFYPETRLWDGK